MMVQDARVLTHAQIFRVLDRTYGPQHWWPAESNFEVMVGAILTQNTSWTNVEKAIDNLKQAGALDCTRILQIKKQRLAQLIRPSGYFNIKADRLRCFCRWYQRHYPECETMSDRSLRDSLLEVKGIGPETADDILLYAFARPVFVIDAYTRRLWQRLGDTPADNDYESWRNWFENKLRRLNNKVGMFNQFHALIVRHAKQVCRARGPLCEDCCLQQNCQYAGAAENQPA